MVAASAVRRDGRRGVQKGQVWPLSCGTSDAVFMWAIIKTSILPIYFEFLHYKDL